MTCPTALMHPLFVGLELSLIHIYPAVQEDVDAYRRLIDEKFYPCNTLVFRGLAELYVTDERFTAYFEAFAPGFAAYLSQAMRRYCDTKETA